MTETKTHHPEHKAQNTEHILIGLLALVLIITLFNSVQLLSLKSIGSAAASVVSGGSGAGISTAGIDVIPKGTPEIYGAELGVKYDDVSASNLAKTEETIRTLGTLDVNIKLSGAELERYISIASKISCEYCCGAESIIFSNGQPACGCAHSYAMRGVAKYLITKHGKEFTDDQILEELGKWKTLFFPGQIAQKAAILKAQGIELNYINLASNKYRGIEQGSGGGGMVGGC